MVNYSLAQKRVGCYGDNLPPKVMNVEYFNAYLFNYSCLNLSDVPPHKVERGHFNCPLELYRAFSGNMLFVFYCFVLTVLASLIPEGEGQIFLQFCPNSCLSTS